MAGAGLGWHTPSAPGYRSGQSLCCGRLSSLRSCLSRSSTVLSCTGAASTPQFKLLSASRSLCAGSSADSTRLDSPQPGPPRHSRKPPPSWPPDRRLFPSLSLSLLRTPQTVWSGLASYPRTRLRPRPAQPRFATLFFLLSSSSLLSLTILFYCSSFKSHSPSLLLVYSEEDSCYCNTP